VPLFVWMWRTDRATPLGTELRRGAWLVAYLVLLTLLSWLGSFSGAGYLASPYDSIVVGLVALVVFPRAVRAGCIFGRVPR
jgi:hypothetical protein